MLSQHNVSDGLTWSETRSANHTSTVVYEGPGAPSTRFWMGVLTVVMMVGFVKLVYMNPENPSWAKLIPFIIAGGGIALAVSGSPGSRRGRIETASGRMRVRPTGLALKIDVALAEVVSFSTATDENTYTVQAGSSVVTQVERRYRVYLYERDGHRYTVATFGKPAPAARMVEQLEALVARERRLMA